jgi:membrane protein
MLLLSISNAFDAIWHSQSERALISKLLVCWSIITLAPLLLGASVSLSSYFFTIA